MNTRKKIHENDRKIRIIITIVLTAFLTYRILMIFKDDSYVRGMARTQVFPFIAYAPYFVMAADLFLVFYKGRAAVVLSIINIALSFFAAFINGMLFVVGLFATLISGSTVGMYESIVEITINVFSMAAAGALLVLNEQKGLDNRSDVNYKLPLTKRVWQAIKRVYQIMKENKKTVLLIIKLLISAGLAWLFIRRIYAAFEEYSFTGSFYNGKQYIFAAVPFLLIPSEIVSLFLKGKPAIAVRIANIITAGGMVIIEGLIIGLVLFAAVWGRISGDFSFYLYEFAENIILQITAIGIFIGGLVFNKKTVKTKK